MRMRMREGQASLGVPRWGKQLNKGECPRAPFPLHPPGKTLCEALLVPAWEGRRGAAAVLVSRGTTVPLSRSKNNFPPPVRVSHVEDSLFKGCTSTYTRKYQQAYSLLSLHGTETHTPFPRPLPTGTPRLDDAEGTRGPPASDSGGGGGWAT